MNISLPPELEELVTDKVKAGLYKTPSEVVGEGLRLLRERDQGLDEVRREVRSGFEAVERGEFTEYDEGDIRALGERIKARGRERLDREELQTNTK